MAITWSTYSPTGTGAQWNCVVHGEGTWVAIRYNSTQASYSTDGAATWNAASMPSAASWATAAYGNGVFIATTSGGLQTAASSPDGITWTERTMPEFGNWYAAFGNGVFVAVSRGTDDAATTTDGATWTARTLPSVVNWTAVAYGAGLFVAIANNTDVYATSPDGVTWTARTLPADELWQGIAWSESLGLFVVCCYGPAYVITSPDGINWTSRSLPDATDAYKVAWDGEKFVLFTDYVDNAVYTSIDGVTWITDTDLPGALDGVYDAYLDETTGQFLATSYETDNLYGYLVTLAVNADASDTANAAASGHGDVWPTLAESLSASATITPEVLANLIERLRLATSLDMDATLAGNASDGITFTDRVLGAWNLLLAEEISTADAAAANVRKLAAIIDALVASGQASGTNHALASCTAAIALQSLLNAGYSANAVDTVTLADTTAGIARILAPMLDSLTAADAATPIARVSVVGAESVSVAADLSTVLRANVDVRDGLLVYVALRVGGDEFTGWVLNTRLQAGSTYTNMPFDSLAAFANMHFAAGRDGLVQFTGTSDTGGPINATIRSFLSDFGTGVVKRAPDAWLAVTNTGDVVFKVITRARGTGAICEDYYRAERGPAANEGKARVKIGRGLTSTYFGYTLVNVDGAPLELDGVEWRPIALSRRT